MRGIAYTISLFLCFGLFALMMRVKADVSLLVQERQDLAEQRQQLKEDVRVLEAEYALLASPVRLTELALARGFKEPVARQFLGGW
jgi:hypothetical protein